MLGNSLIPSLNSCTEIPNGNGNMGCHCSSNLCLAKMTEMTKIKSSRTVGFAFDSTALPISIHMNFRFAIRCRCRWVECFVIADVYQVAAEKHYTGQPSPSLWHPTEDTTITLPYGIIGFSKYSLEVKEWDTIVRSLRFITCVWLTRNSKAFYSQIANHPQWVTLLLYQSDSWWSEVIDE